MIFLDANIISYYFNADNIVKEKMLEAIDNDEEICTTVINIYEIINNRAAGPHGMLLSKGICIRV
jgi:predicted nucleic acid-binding protein